MNHSLGRRLSVTVAAFVLLGVFWGTFAVLLADLAGEIGLSPGPLGVALFVGAVASIVSMALFGWASDVVGRRIFVLAALVVFGVGIFGLSSAGSFAGLILALVVIYIGSGLYDVGINASAIDIEREVGRRIMAYFHASFSAGGFVGAVASGFLLAAGTDYRVVYLLVLVPLAVVAVMVITTNLSSPAPADETSENSGSIFSMFANRALLLVAFIATLGLLSEGEMEHWSGVYLRDSLGLSALAGGTGVAVFFGAMAVGRIGAASLINAFGTRRVLRVAGVLAAAGMAISLATTQPVLVVLGFLIVGFALSAVVPIAFSLAGDMVAPEKVGAATSVLTTTSYGGFLLGPVMVGGLAEVFGLRLALATIIVAGAAIFILSLRLKSRKN